MATYIAHGDVALSVLMTTASTVGAIFMTPLLTKLLAGALVPVDAAVSRMRAAGVAGVRLWIEIAFKLGPRSASGFCARCRLMGAARPQSEGAVASWVPLSST